KRGFHGLGELRRHRTVRDNTHKTKDWPAIGDPCKFPANAAPCLLQKTGYDVQYWPASYLNLYRKQDRRVQRSWYASTFLNNCGPRIPTGCFPYDGNQKMQSPHRRVWLYR